MLKSKNSGNEDFQNRGLSSENSFGNKFLTYSLSATSLMNSKKNQESRRSNGKDKRISLSKFGTMTQISSATPTPRYSSRVSMLSPRSKLQAESKSNCF